MDLQTEAPVVDRAPPVSTPTETTTPRERVPVKDTIRDAFRQAREETERQEREVTSREPDETEDTTQDASTTDTDRDVDRSTETGTGTQVGTAEDTETAPVSWSKEAKEEFKSAPERIRKEVLKREKDMERGVQALKGKYKEIDEAIEPYRPVIEQFGKTPGQAVGQLFAWFDALAKNPDEAFPALVDSYKYDLRRMIERKYPGVMNRYAQMEQYIKQMQQGQKGQAAQNGQAQPQQNGQAQQQVPIHPQVQQYIQHLHNEITGLKEQVGQHGQQFQSINQYAEQQNAARTQEFLDQWSQSKPHFESVRTMMGHLLTPDPNTGVAAIPLTADGRVDLDAAYEAAIYAMPEIRAKVLAEQQAKVEAERKAKQDAKIKAEQDKAAAARRASGSLTTSAPGAEISRSQTPSRGKSVKESLREAISQLSER